MRIFVTGAAGYIGGAVARAFRRHGHSVMGMVRNENDIQLLKKLEIEPLLGFLQEPASFLPHIRDREVLVHCAFEPSPQGVELDLKTIDTFIEISLQANLARTFIYTSGCWVYGSSQGQWRDESSALNPIPLVKWRPSHETRVLNGCKGVLKTTVIRPGCVFGGSSGLTTAWFKSVAEGRPLVPGSGEQRWPMIHVDDLAELYVLAAEKEINFSILNATDGRSHSVLEYVTAIARSQKIEIPMQKLSSQETFEKYGKLADGLLVDLQLSSEKAERLLNWRSRHPSLLDEPAIYFEAWKSANL